MLVIGGGHWRRNILVIPAGGGSWRLFEDKAHGECWKRSIFSDHWLEDWIDH